jgi:hypothetical protein
MRTLLVAVAIFIFAAGTTRAGDGAAGGAKPATASAGTAKAADDDSSKDDKLSSIVGKLPDTQDNRHHIYLFMLTKNGITLRMSGDQFCAAMHYNEAVKGDWERVKDADVPKRMKCVDHVINGEHVRSCDSGKAGEIYIERSKDGKHNYYKAIVFEGRSKATKDQVDVPGDLDWVFCSARIEK